MLSQPRSLTPVQFFSAGNLISAGLQLYREHFKTYLRLSFLGMAWLIVPLIVLAGGGFALAETGNSAFLLALIPISLGGLLIGFAKYQAFSAAIARLSFTQLINDPETPTASSQFTNRRKWGFWLISFLVFLVFLGLLIGFYILLTILIVILFVAVSGVNAFTDTTPPDDATLMAIGLGALAIFLLLGIPTIIFFLWMFSHFFIPDVVYAIEPETEPASSLTRSWSLTTRSSWRVVLLLILLFVVLAPFQVLLQIVSAVIQGTAIALDPTQGGVLWTIAFIASYVLSIALGVVLLPVWQTVKAVLYYDLRSRREGMGLSLEPRDSSIPTVMQLFKRVTLVTPESVELEFTLAGIGSRAHAVLMDYAILTIGSLLFWILWGLFAYQLSNYLEQTGIDYSGLPLWLLAIGILLSFIGTTGYFVGFEVLRQGQTPGKRFAKIRVIRDDGRPVGLAQAVLRSLVQPIDFFLFLGAFLIFFGKREKRLGDWAAGTLVIQENRANRKAITLSDDAKAFAVSLSQPVDAPLADTTQTQTTGTDFTKLRPDQFAVISEYLQRRTFMTRLAKAELSLDLARQVRSIIQLETIPDGMTSDVFLEAVYLAYQEQFPGY
jgi:uncharacterized RDD family membrane protein YckC